MGGLEELLSVGIAMAHHEMHGDAQQDRRDREKDCAWDAGGKQDTGEQNGADRHRQATAHGCHSEYRRPNAIAITTIARPALIHGLLARFERAI